MDKEIELDNLGPKKNPAKVVEETFLRTKKQEWIWNTTGRKELMTTVTVHCSLLWIISKEDEHHWSNWLYLIVTLYVKSTEVEIQAVLVRQTFKKQTTTQLYGLLAYPIFF